MTTACLIDFEAYRQVLGCCLLDDKFVIQADERLKPEYFLENEYAEVFRRMIEVYKRDGFFNLSQSKDLLSGIEFLTVSSLMEMQANTILSQGSFDHYCQAISERYQRRKIVEASEKMQKVALNTDEPVTEVISKFERYYRWALLSQETEATDIFVILQDTVKEIEERRNVRAEYGGFYTGYHKLDRLLDGLVKSRYYICSADTSVGKTTFALNAILGPLRQGARVAYFSQEMSKRQLCQRLITMTGEFSGKCFKTQEMSQFEYDAYLKAQAEIEMFRLNVFTQKRLDIRYIRREIRKLKMTTGLDIVVIDYIQQVRDPEFRGYSENDRLTEISAQVQEIANSEDLALIVLSQESREGKKQAAQGVKMSPLWRLRGSGSLENDADVVISLERDKDEEPEILHWNVAKNRHGKLGRGTLNFDLESQKISNFEEV